MRKLATVVAAALVGGAMISAPGTVAAQDYPNRPVEWIVPSSAGSGFDVVARLITPKLSEVLGQTVVIQNIAGAGGTVGSAKAAEAAADGYTVLMINVNHTANEALRPNKSYDLLKNFDTVIRFADSHYVIVVPKASEIETLEGLLAAAKAKPGELNWASAGVGSSTYMLGIMFATKSGIDATHIPYEGGGPAVAATVAGEVDFYGAPYATAKPFIEEGTLKALAITAADRLAFLPDLPSTSEQVPGFAFTSWYGMVMPAGAPDEAKEKFNAAMVEALQDPAVRKGLEDLGLDLFVEDPDDFKAYLEKEIAVMKEVVAEAGVPVQ